MKKLLISALSVLLVVMLAVGANAATAFGQLVVEDAVMLDDDTTQDQGGSGQPIQIVDGYGVGYSSLNDMVEFKAVDFGSNGAKAMTINFSYGNDDDSTTTLDVMVDDPKSAPVCSYTIGFTGGWESTNAQPFTADCAIAGGTHDVYVKFTNDKSGSFTWISFTEADPVIETEAPATTAAETAAPAVAETAAVTAAQTSDITVAAAVLCLLASGAYVALRNKKS